MNGLSGPDRRPPNAPSPLARASDWHDPGNPASAIGGADVNDPKPTSTNRPPSDSWMIPFLLLAFTACEGLQVENEIEQSTQALTISCGARPGTGPARYVTSEADGTRAL